MLKKLASATVAIALTTAPALAAPVNPAAKLSVSPSVRAGATKGGDKLAAPGSIIALVLGAAIVAGGIIIAVDDDDDSDSN